MYVLPTPDTPPCEICFSDQLQHSNAMGLFRNLDINRLRPHLVPELPTLQPRQGDDIDETYFVFCRRCGLPYVYAVYCDSSYGPPPPHPSEEFRRLCFQSAIERLPKSARETFEAELPRRAQHMRQVVHHERPDVREQAVYFLIAWENANRNWSAIRALITHEDPKVAAMSLFRSGYRLEFAEACGDTWEALLAHPHKGVRQQAATKLIKWYQQINDEDKLSSLLKMSDKAIQLGVKYHR